MGSFLSHTLQHYVFVTDGMCTRRSGLNTKRVELNKKLRVFRIRLFFTNVTHGILSSLLCS